MSLEKSALGNAIRISRNNKGMTQEQLAEAIGLAPNYIKHLERGRRNPSLIVLYHLAQKLDFSIDDVFFPKHAETQELRRKIELRLRCCSIHELNVIYKTLEALTEELCDRQN